MSTEQVELDAERLAERFRRTMELRPELKDRLNEVLAPLDRIAERLGVVYAVFDRGAYADADYFMQGRDHEFGHGVDRHFMNMQHQFNGLRNVWFNEVAGFAPSSYPDAPQATEFDPDKFPPIDFIRRRLKDAIYCVTSCKRLLDYQALGAASDYFIGAWRHARDVEKPLRELAEQWMTDYR
jgi:hypothetical protein